MRIPKEQLKAETERFQVHKEDNYLRLVLESYYFYNHRARLDIAEILYRKYLELSEDSTNDNLRRLLTAEIYSKLMQIIEDSAMLAIMFTSRQKTPIEIFTSISNDMLYKFFGKAKRGLRDKAIWKMLGLKSAKKLLYEGSISRAELTDFERILRYIVDGTSSVPGERERWMKLGRAYTKEYRKPSTKSFKINFTKSGLTSVYFNLKHNFKILLPTATFFKIWPTVDKTLSLEILEDYKELSKLITKVPKEWKQFENRKLMVLGKLEVNREALSEIFERIYPHAQEIKSIAQFQLKLLDDPNYTVREMRWIIFKQKGSPLPLPHKKCPCQSGRKFRNCHNESDKDDDLYFNRFKYETLQPSRSRILR